MVSIVLCVSRMCLVMFRNASNYVVGNSALCLPCVSGHVVYGVCDMILVIFCNESCMVLVVCSMFTVGVLEMLRSMCFWAFCVFVIWVWLSVAVCFCRLVIDVLMFPMCLDMLRNVSHLSLVILCCVYHVFLAIVCGDCYMILAIFSDVLHGFGRCSMFPICVW